MPMLEWLNECFSNIVNHYKAMTTLVLIASILKITVPVIGWILNKYQDWAHRKNIIKIWTDAGFSPEYAEKMYKSHKDSIESKLREVKGSKTSFVKRIFKK
jgi:hypothetical protein